MSPRTRTIRYGASIVVSLVGVACGATISGSLGGTLATVFVGLGLVGIVSLVFYEVGLTEDRDRARRDAREPPPLEDDPPSPGRPGGHVHAPEQPVRRGPGRLRGQRRRLR